MTSAYSTSQWSVDEQGVRAHAAGKWKILSVDPCSTTYSKSSRHVSATSSDWTIHKNKRKKSCRLARRMYLKTNKISRKSTGYDVKCVKDEDPSSGGIIRFTKIRSSEISRKRKTSTEIAVQTDLLLIDSDECTPISNESSLNLSNISKNDLDPDVPLKKVLHLDQPSVDCPSDNSDVEEILVEHPVIQNARNKCACGGVREPIITKQSHAVYKFTTNLRSTLAKLNCSPISTPARPTSATSEVERVYSSLPEIRGLSKDNIESISSRTLPTSAAFVSDEPSSEINLHPTTTDTTCGSSVNEKSLNDIDYVANPETEDLTSTHSFVTLTTESPFKPVVGRTWSISHESVLDSSQLNEGKDSAVSSADPDIVTAADPVITTSTHLSRDSVIAPSTDLSRDQVIAPSTDLSRDQVIASSAGLSRDPFISTSSDLSRVSVIAPSADPSREPVIASAADLPHDPVIDASANCIVRKSISTDSHTPSSPVEGEQRHEDESASELSEQRCGIMQQTKEDNENCHQQHRSYTQNTTALIRPFSREFVDRATICGNDCINRSAAGVETSTEPIDEEQQEQLHHHQLESLASTSPPSFPTEMIRNAVRNVTSATPILNTCRCDWHTSLSSSDAIPNPTAAIAPLSVSLNTEIMPVAELDIKLSPTELDLRTASRYTCSICGLTFTYSSEQIKQHENSHCLTLKHQCRSCHASFGSRHDLAVHARTLHTSMYLCSVCGEMFSSINLLQVHLCYSAVWFNFMPHPRNVPVLIERGKDVARCRACKKYFLNANVQTHVQLHGGETTRRCSLCFMPRGSKHQCFSFLTPHSCNSCGLEFVGGTALARHVCLAAIKHKRSAVTRFWSPIVLLEKVD